MEALASENFSQTNCAQIGYLDSDFITLQKDLQLIEIYKILLGLS